MNQELKDLFIQAENEKYDEDIASCQEPVEVSNRHKRNMNRIFRELVHSKFIPYSDVDNFYERTRSWLIVKLHLLK